MLTAEELLAGSALTFEVEVPASVLRPANGSRPGARTRTVRLRPLTVADLQLVVARGARRATRCSAR